MSGGLGVYRVLPPDADASAGREVPSSPLRGRPELATTAVISLAGQSSGEAQIDQLTATTRSRASPIISSTPIWRSSALRCSPVTR